MANYVPNIAEQLLLDVLIAEELDSAELRLFVANHTPVAGDVAATYLAIEAAFGGYAPQTLNSWTPAAINAGGAAETEETVRTFLATGAGLPETVFGVFVLDLAGDLVYADKFATGGITLAAAGQTVSYLPKFTLSTT